MTFVLKKCIAAFLLPPGIFILLLLGAAWRFHHRGRRRAFLFTLFVLTAIWGLSLAWTAGELTSALESGFTIPAQPRGDAIILLGGGVNDLVPDLSGRGVPTEGMLPRVVTAVRLQRRLGIPVLVSGGAVFDGRTPEAVIVKRFLIDLGVPENKILTESKSRDTVENARFSKEILKRHGLHTPLLVTSAYHMRRSVMAFRRAGLEVTPVPAQFLTSSETAPTTWADWLPSADSLNDSSRALREYLGILFYRLGGQGGT